MQTESNSQYNDSDFAYFKKKIKVSHGIDLDLYKSAQMERRLRANMEKYGAKSFLQYYALIQKNSNLLDDFFDRMTINVSELYRNPDQFDLLQKIIIPELLTAKRPLNIWSAGCSYGAEPYSVSIILNELAGNMSHRILATDIDDKMLERAKVGIFKSQEMKNVPRSKQLKYFDNNADEYHAKDTLKKYITFRKHNLLSEPFKQNFDLIICRNVVIYFTEEAKSVLYKNFAASLKTGGYMFVGGTERIVEADSIGLRTELPFFYKKI